MFLIISLSVNVNKKIANQLEKISADTERERYRSLHATAIVGGRRRDAAFHHNGL